MVVNVIRMYDAIAAAFRVLYNIVYGGVMMRLMVLEFLHDLPITAPARGDRLRVARAARGGRVRLRLRDRARRPRPVRGRDVPPGGRERASTCCGCGGFWRRGSRFMGTRTSTTCGDARRHLMNTTRTTRRASTSSATRSARRWRRCPRRNAAPRARRSTTCTSCTPTGVRRPSSIAHASTGRLRAARQYLHLPPPARRRKSWTRRSTWRPRRRRSRRSACRPRSRRASRDARRALLHDQLPHRRARHARARPEHGGQLPPVADQARLPHVLHDARRAGRVDRLAGEVVDLSQSHYGPLDERTVHMYEDHPSPWRAYPIVEVPGQTIRSYTPEALLHDKDTARIAPPRRRGGLGTAPARHGSCETRRAAHCRQLWIRTARRRAPNPDMEQRRRADRVRCASFRLFGRRWRWRERDGGGGGRVRGARARDARPGLHVLCAESRRYHAATVLLFVDQANGFHGQQYARRRPRRGTCR